ncbi:glycosyl-4,4'-diaponeurosporenoate acyltransferase CrtO family protein [Methylomagnum sp.]
MRILSLPVVWTVALDILAWLLIHMGVALALARWPLNRFDPKGGWYRIRVWEYEGRIYERTFRVRSWKKYLPDGAPLLGRYGFPKQRLGARSAEYFRAFARETCRAELAHWIIPLFAPLFFLWNRPEVGILMMVYAVVENLPLIVAQRYNRARLLKLLERRERKDGL